MPHTLKNRMILFFHHITELFAIAECYEQGQYIEQDISTSMQLYLEAGKNGHVAAYYRLGYLLEQQNDTSQALIAFLKAANQGNSDASAALERLAQTHIPKAAYYFAQYYESNKDYEQARNWYQQEITDFNDINAMHAFARLLTNPFEQLAQYYNAAQAGHLPAIDALVELTDEHSRAYFYLGQLFEAGIPSKLNRDTQRAIAYYRRGSDKNDVESAFRLGIIYQHGTDAIAIDNQSACHYYFQALSLGKMEVTTSLETILPILNNPAFTIKLAAYFTSINHLDKATNWYLHALAQPLNDTLKEQAFIQLKTSPELTFQIATAYHYGLNTTIKSYRACRLDVMAMQQGHSGSTDRILKMADDGNTIAQYVLAVEYYRPQGDYQKAFCQLALLSSQGCQRSQRFLQNTHFTESELLCLAKIYETGNGVAINLSAAISYYEKACAFKNPETQLKLAKLYYENHPSVERQPEKAFKLCLNAFENGATQALDILKQLEEEVSTASRQALKKLQKKASATSIRQLTAQHMFTPPKNTKSTLDAQHLLILLTNG